MISKQRILKESEFKWIIESGNAELIQKFLENRLVFTKTILLDSIEGNGVLKFLRNKISGLIYIEFKTFRNNLGQESKSFDKIYFQNTDDMEKFEVTFNQGGDLNNVINIFEE